MSSIPVELHNQIEMLKAIFNPPEINTNTVTLDDNFYDEEGNYLIKLGNMYKNGEILLNRKEQLLFNAIFKYREDQKRVSYILGEAIHMIKQSRDRGSLDEELVWWMY